MCLLQHIFIGPINFSTLPGSNRRIDIELDDDHDQLLGILTEKTGSPQWMTEKSGSPQYVESNLLRRLSTSTNRDLRPQNQMEIEADNQVTFGKNIIKLRQWGH